MMFRTQFDERQCLYSEVGSPIHILYSPKYDVDGTLDLVETGIEDMDEFIQSFAESTDINNIVARFTAGDKSALSRAQGFFADVSGVPHTYAEVLNSIITAETTFDSLPVDVKRSFGNNFANWLSTMDAPEWLEKMQLASSPSDVSKTADFVSDSSMPGASAEDFSSRGDVS